MRLEFIRDWRGHLRGEVKDIEAGVGEAYIIRGVARMVNAVTQKIKPALVARKQK